MAVRACLFASIDIVASKKFKFESCNADEFARYQCCENCKKWSLGRHHSLPITAPSPHCRTVIAYRDSWITCDEVSFGAVVALPVNIVASRSTTDITMTGIRLDIVKLAQALIRAVILKFLTHGGLGCPVYYFSKLAELKPH